MGKWFTLAAILWWGVAGAQINNWIGPNGDNNWSNAANWSAGLPTAAHDVRINGASDNPVLDIPVGNALLISVINGASLDLNGNAIDAVERMTITSSSIIGNGNLNFGRCLITSSSFTGDVNFKKMGGVAGNSTISGTTTFNGTTVFDNQSPSTNLVVANTDLSDVVFVGPATFIRTASNIVVASRGLVTFQDDATLQVASTGATFNIAATGLGAVAFEANLYINSSVGGTFNIGDTGGPDIFMDGTIKTAGFMGGGTFNFDKINQSSTNANDPFSINTCALTDCDFGGGWTLTANTINLSGSGFNGVNTFQSRFSSVSNCAFNPSGGSTSFTKVLGSTVNWNGGNTFYGPFTYTRSGNGIVNLSNVAGNIFFANANFINTTAVGSLNPLSGVGQTSSFSDTISTLGSTFPVTFSPGTMEIDGTGDRHFNGTGAHTVSNLIINTDPGGSLTLNVPLNITIQATFTSGILYSSSTFLPIFAAGATATGASDISYVDGPVRKVNIPTFDVFEFPTGDAGFYGPIGVEIASGTPTFTAQFFYASPEGGGYPPDSLDIMVDHVSQSEYWNLDASNLGSAHVLLYWGPRSQGVTDPGALLVSHWDGAMWSSPSTVTFLDNMDGTGYLRTDNALTSFSPFTLGSSLPLPANPLPINLLSFTARPDGQNVQLNWATASEQNNALFTVERSADGRIFTPVATLPGAGTSFETLYYETQDRLPLEGTSYYRLVQTDFDGKSAYSPMVSVTRNSTNGDDIRIFPNPASNLLTIETKDQSADVSLVNFNGAVVAPAIHDETGRWTLDVSALTPGWYALVIRTADTVYTEKVLIKR